MAYDNFIDTETGLSIGTIQDGRIVDSEGVEIGYVVDNVAHGMAGNVWGPLGDARAQTGPAPMPDAMRRALRRDP